MCDSVYVIKFKCMKNNLIKVSDRFYIYPYEELTDRPNLFYIKGDDYSVVVDAGNSAKHVKQFYDCLNDNNLPLPFYTIISHWHWDHTFGLSAINGISLSSEKARDKLIEVSKWKWNIEEMRKREKTGEDIAFCNDCILLEYEDLNDIKVVSSDQIVNDDLHMDLGGIEIDILPRVSTHTDDTLYVYIKDEKALIVEDADNCDFYNHDYYDPIKLEKMIEFFENLDYEYHYLGHASRESKMQAIDRLNKVLIDIKK